MKSALIHEITQQLGKDSSFGWNRKRQRICIFLDRLFSEKLTKFKWPSILMASEIESIELWQSLLAKCPKLVSLEFTLTKERNPANPASYLNPLFKTALPDMQMLTLKGFECTNAHLQAMAVNLPNIR